MIGDLFNNNKKRDVITREGQRFYKGKKYAIEKDTGYYVCTTVDESGIRRRLHVVMWEAEHGEKVGEGEIIHHKDWNKNNNVPENLEKVTVEEHNLIHNPPPPERQTEREKMLLKGLRERGLI